MVLNRLSPICIRFRNSSVGSREVKSRFSSRNNSYSCLNYKQLKYKLITDCKVSLKWTLVLYKNFELPKCPSMYWTSSQFCHFRGKTKWEIETRLLVWSAWEPISKPRLHYNVLSTAWLIFWYGCRLFSARHGASNSDSRDFKIYDAAFKTKELFVQDKVNG